MIIFANSRPILSTSALHKQFFEQITLPGIGFGLRRLNLLDVQCLTAQTYQHCRRHLNMVS